MKAEGKVLVLVDAPGGPTPALYAPMLPREVDVHVVVLRAQTAEALAARIAPLRDCASLTIVDDRDALEATIDRVAQQVRADGMVAFSERVVHAAMAVAHRRGLRANPPAVQHALCDKLAQRCWRLRKSASIRWRATRFSAGADPEHLLERY